MNAKERVLEAARSKAATIKADVEVALDAARTLAQSLTATKDPQNPSS